jgi:hypothetical protein
VSFLKNDPELIAAQLSAREPLTISPQTGTVQRSIASIYNRLGGLMETLARKTSVDVPGIAAVWYVESSGLPFIPKRAIVRLEVHQLYEVWGKRNRTVFDSHFRFGGHNGQGGNPWENQEYRTQTTGAFHAVHHNQSSEYAALTLAQIIAGDEIAFSCSSIGGFQVMMNSFQMLGYESAKDMHDSFQASESTHVLTFFDFCSVKPAPKAGDLLNYLRTRDWKNFARFYNGAGQVPIYADKLKAAYDATANLIKTPQAA